MFTDVSPDRWSAEYIQWMVDMDVISGFPDGTFRPEEPLTREQLAVILRRYSFAQCLWDKNMNESVPPAVVTVVRQDGLGTGFFINLDTIITNNHVVKGATSLTTTTDSKYAAINNLPITVLATSEYYDLALCRVPVKWAFYLPISKREIRRGKHVAVFGSPKGYSYSLTQGVISNPKVAKDPISDTIYFQTDAPINPGNSGGPVVDGYGEVVGVACAKFVSVDTEAMGFAIRAEFVREFCRQNEVSV